MFKNILQKSAFTITEMLTVTTILVIMSGAISVGISSFNSSNGILTAENIFYSKIRNEKISVISGELKCSETTISYGEGFFSVFNGEKGGDFCKKNIFGKIKKDGNYIKINLEKVNLSLNIDPNTTEIFTNSSRKKDLDFNINADKGILTFELLEKENIYKIIGEGIDGKTEVIEIIFFNQNPVNSEENPIFISVEKISGMSFKNNKILGDELKIYFFPNKEGIIKLRGIRSNNIKIYLGNLNGEETFFNFFSANLTKNINNKIKLGVIELDLINFE